MNSSSSNNNKIIIIIIMIIIIIIIIPCRREDCGSCKQESADVRDELPLD